MIVSVLFLLSLFIFIIHFSMLTINVALHHRLVDNVTDNDFGAIFRYRHLMNFSWTIFHVFTSVYGKQAAVINGLLLMALTFTLDTAGIKSSFLLLGNYGWLLIPICFIGVVCYLFNRIYAKEESFRQLGKVPAKIGSIDFKVQIAVREGGLEEIIQKLYELWNKESVMMRDAFIICYKNGEQTTYTALLSNSPPIDKDRNIRLLDCNFIFSEMLLSAIDGWSIGKFSTEDLDRIQREKIMDAIDIVGDVKCVHLNHYFLPKYPDVVINTLKKHFTGKI